MEEDNLPKPWESYPNIWKNKTAFYQYIRNSLRRTWMKNPAKLEYIKKHRVRIPNPSPKGRAKEVWGMQCEICKKYYKQADVQIDHINPAGRLNGREDIKGFVERLLFVDDSSIRALCKKCHSAISYSERKGISFEEAKIEKEAIAIMKKNSGKDWLKDKGHTPASNAKKRREQIVEILRKTNV